MVAAAPGWSRRLRSLYALVLVAAGCSALSATPARAAGSLGPPPEGLEQTYYGEITASSHEVHAGEVITFTETPKEGGTFEGWGYQEPVSFPGYVSGCTKESTTCSFKAESGEPYPGPGQSTSWLRFSGGFCGFFGCAGYETYYYVVGTASISGYVLDGLGEPVPNTTVSISGPESRVVQTNEAGVYTASFEEGGTYTVSVQESAEVTGVKAWQCPGTTEGNTCVVEVDSGSVNEVGFKVETHPVVSIATPQPVLRPDEGKTGVLDFPVTLADPATHPVTVVAATSNGTATVGVDYQETKQTLTFPTGSTGPVQLQVPLIGTPPVGEPETFSVSLSEPQGAALGTSTATGTILCSAPVTQGVDSSSQGLSLRAQAAAMSPCQLNVTPEASTNRPTAGLFDQNGFVRFLSADGSPQTIKVGGADVEFPQGCLSGCANIAVRVTAYDGTPVDSHTSITATVTPLLFQAVESFAGPSPFSVQPPSSGNGYVCDLSGECGTTVTGMTNGEGIARFRYWVPGLVESSNGVLAYPAPVERIRFGATSHTLCPCFFGAKGEETLTLQPGPRLWLNKNVVVTQQEIDGLQAVLSKNADNKKNAKKRAEGLVKVLEGAKYLVNDTYTKAAKAFKNLALAEALDQLMRRDPDSVMLSWFMGKFGIAGNGILDENLDPRAWGQELRPLLVSFLTKKITSIKVLGKVEDQISGQLDKWAKAAIGDAWAQQVVKITKELVERSLEKPRTNDRATIKVFDVSTCGGSQCSLPPLPQASEHLFLLFSETNAGHPENYFWPHPSLESEAPIKFNPQVWIPAQCGREYGCDTENK